MPEDSKPQPTAEAGSAVGKEAEAAKPEGSPAALTASADATADADAKKKKAISDLPPVEVADLLKLNPALAKELDGESSTAEGAEESAEASSSASAAAPAAAATATATVSSSSKGASSAGSSSLPPALAALRNLSLADIMTGLATSGKNAKDMASYKFWKTQPVPRFGEDDATPATIAEGPIQTLTVDQVPPEPAKLLDGFEWDTLDLTDDAQLQEVFDLLEGHFVEDGEAMFRFRYSKSILKWAMMSPGWIKDWHVGVRASQSRKLVAFIAAVPLELRVRDKTLHASEVNFLVVHKKLRAKRLAPVLIKEITRRCNLKGVWQALYTAGVVLPKPVSTSRYYHRSVNWQKLYEVGFSPLPANSKPQFQVRKYALPDRTSVRGLRDMQARDIDAVHSLLGRYLQRFDMAMDFSRDEIDHWLLDKKLPGDEQVVYSYVVEDDNHQITDFFSFYCLESSVINHPRHKVIRAAYLFYYATEVGLTKPSVDKAALKTRLDELMRDALILSKRHRFDVVNALSIMDNALFLEKQKFGAGDGQLHYYLFNYRANPITGGVTPRNELDEDRLSGIGFVMM